MAVVALLCSVAASGYNFEVDGICYNVTSETDLTVEIIEGDYKYRTKINIPENVTSYDGTLYSVVSIGNNAFSGCRNLTSVTMGNSITSIGEYAFNGCSGLTSITIPNSVTEIVSYAFGNCSNLTKVTIGSGVKSINWAAFNGCDSLTNMVVESSNSVYDSRDNCNAIIETATNTLVQGCKNTIIPNSVTSIGEYAFYNCDGLTNIEIPGSVTNIGYAAFENCANLRNVTIPNSVITIGDEAFSSCSALTSITFPESLINIGEYAFNGCSGLTSVTIPNSVTNIRRGAFAYCFNLANIAISDSVINIGDDAFGATAWYYNQPDGVVYIGKTLYKYKGIMPNNTSIEIKEGTLNIAGAAFENSEYENNTIGLTSITFPEGLINIGEYAFCCCSGLTSVTIPESVTNIRSCAFYGCINLENFTILNSVINIGDDAFGATAWYYNQPDGVVYIGKTLYKYKGRMPDDTSIEIKEGILNIGVSAFTDCYGLKNITIPNSVTSIGEYAFIGCYDLQNVYLLGEIPVAINDDTFRNYDATLYVPQGSLEAYKAADVWKKFKNIVEFDPTGIEDVTADAPAFEITAGGVQLTDADGKAIAIYAPNGALVEKIDNYVGEEIALDKGVYIVRVGNKTMKVKL